MLALSANTRPERNYVLALPPDVTDVGGVPLPDVGLRFSTRSAAGLEPPRIRASTPAVGARDVPLDLGSIRVTFSSPMRPATGFASDAVRAQAAAGCAWPPIEFGRWLDTHTVEFALREALRPGTRYALPFGNRFVDERGLPCEPLVVHFETAGG